MKTERVFAAVRYDGFRPVIHPMFVRRTARQVRADFGENFSGWDNAKKHGWCVEPVIVALEWEWNNHIHARRAREAMGESK